MTHLLQKAFGEASKLPPAEQDALAKELLHALASEEGWATAFDTNSPRLEGLAKEALLEHRSGATKDLDPDSL